MLQCNGTCGSPSLQHPWHVFFGLIRRPVAVRISSGHQPLWMLGGSEFADRLAARWVECILVNPSDAQRAYWPHGTKAFRVQQRIAFSLSTIHTRNPPALHVLCQPGGCRFLGGMCSCDTLATGRTHHLIRLRLTQLPRLTCRCYRQGLDIRLRQPVTPTLPPSWLGGLRALWSIFKVVKLELDGYGAGTRR